MITLEREYEYKVFRVGQLEAALQKLREASGLLQSDADYISLHETLYNGASHSRDVTAEELAMICDLEDKAIYVRWRSKTDKRRLRFAITGRRSECLLLSIEFDDGRMVETLLDLTAQTLELQPFKRLVKSKRPKLLFFLSYRFEEKSKDVADTLERFLRLVDVEVITAEEYEPRPISEKVKARLELPLDAVVLILLDNQSFWTRDEIAIANGRGIPIIPLVATETDFTGGVFGDLEFVRFEPDHIEQAFISLLEAIKFIRLNPARFESGS